MWSSKMSQGWQVLYMNYKQYWPIHEPFMGLTDRMSNCFCFGLASLIWCGLPFSISRSMVLLLLLMPFSSYIITDWTLLIDQSNGGVWPVCTGIGCLFVQNWYISVYNTYIYVMLCVYVYFLCSYFNNNVTCRHRDLQSYNWILSGRMFTAGSEG